MFPGAEAYWAGADEAYFPQVTPGYADRVFFWSSKAGMVADQPGSYKASNSYKEKDLWFESPERNCDLLQLANYDSNNWVRLSDHRPVFAQFLLLIEEP